MSTDRELLERARSMTTDRELLKMAGDAIQAALTVIGHPDDAFTDAFTQTLQKLRCDIDAHLKETVQTREVPLHNPWRTSLENCISGDNYLRASEYRDLIEELDDLYRLREAPMQDERKALADECKRLAEELRKVSREVPVGCVFTDKEFGRHKRCEESLHAAIDRLADGQGMADKELAALPQPAGCQDDRLTRAAESMMRFISIERDFECRTETREHVPKIILRFSPVGYDAGFVSGWVDRNRTADWLASMQQPKGDNP